MAYWKMLLIAAAVTYALRALPFVLFSKGKLPDVLVYLGKVLPFAIMGLLVVYTLREIDPFQAPFGAPELIAAAVVVLVHVKKRHMFLSIAAGTITYMLLVQFVSCNRRPAVFYFNRF